MKNIKVQRGITLIALIITIIILLILAVVTIGSIKDSSIITYAQNAANDYEKEKGKEQSILSQYEELIKEQQGEKTGSWKIQEDGKIKNEKTEVETAIGGRISNEDVLKATGVTNSPYTGDWIVLGVENGNLKLVSASNVVNNVYLGREDSKAVVDAKLTVNGISDDMAKAIWSHQHVRETLDEHAVTGTGIPSARSITAEDLEAKEVLNITRETKRQMIASGQNIDANAENYEKIYNYFYDNGEQKVASRNKSTDNGEWSEKTISEFDRQIFIDKNNEIVLVDSANDQITLNSTYWGKYSFSLDSNLDLKNKFGDILDVTRDTSYWLATTEVALSDESASYVTRTVVNDEFFGGGKCMWITIQFTSNNVATTQNYGVRAVVHI